MDYGVHLISIFKAFERLLWVCPHPSATWGSVWDLGSGLNLSPHLKAGPALGLSQACATQEWAWDFRGFLYNIKGPFLYLCPLFRARPPGPPPTHTHPFHPQFILGPWITQARKTVVSHSHLFRAAPCARARRRGSTKKEEASRPSGLPLTFFRLFLCTEIRCFALLFLKFVV